MKAEALQIDLARPEDLDNLWSLYQRTFLKTYTDQEAGITEEKLLDFLAGDSTYLPKNWQGYLQNPSKQRTIFAAKRLGELVGMVSPVFVDGKHRINALYVAPEMQGQGIGSALVKKALTHHGNVDVYIGIASHIELLPHFYESFGFKMIKSEQLIHYPNDPMAYIEMIRPATTG